MPQWRRHIQRIADDPQLPILPWLAPRVFQPWPLLQQKRQASESKVILDRRRRDDAGRKHRERLERLKTGKASHTRDSNSTLRIRKVVPGQSLQKEVTNEQAGPNIWKHRRDYRTRVRDDLFWEPLRTRKHGAERTNASASLDDWFEAIVGETGLDPLGETFAGQATPDLKVTRTEDFFRAPQEPQTPAPKKPSRSSVLTPATSRMPKRRVRKSAVKAARALRYQRVHPNDKRPQRRLNLQYKWVGPRLRRSKYMDGLVKTRIRRFITRRHLLVSQKHAAPRTYFISIGHLRRVRARSRSKSGTSGRQYKYEVGTLSTFWTQWMAKLKGGIDRRQHHSRDLPNPPSLDPSSQLWAEAILKTPRSNRERTGAADLDQIRAQFDRKEDRLRFWQEAMIWTLLNRSGRDALRFLHLTHMEPYPPRYMIAEVLEYLIAAGSHQQPSEMSMLRLARIINVLAHRGPGHLLVVDGAHLSCLLANLSPKHVASILKRWDNSQLPISGNTRLQAADLLARAGRLSAAVEQFRKALQMSRPFVQERSLQSVCVTLLSNSRLVPGRSKTCLDLLSDMVAANVPLNIQICNTIMLSVIDAGDVSMAFKIYEMLKQYNITPDRYTFAILAKGCKRDIEHSERLVAIISDALRHGILLSEPVVATEVLDCLYRHHVQAKRPDAFELVSEAYQQLFDATPLERLGIIASPTEAAVEKRMTPQTPTLRIMLSAYLDAAQPSPEQVLLLYHQIRELALNSEESFVNILDQDYLLNAFIAKFGSWSWMIPSALEVARNMQSDHAASRPPNPTGQPSESSPKARLASPTSLTFSILHAVLCKHATPGNKYLARAILTFDHLKAQDKADFRNWLAMLHAYIRHSDLKGAHWCIYNMKRIGLWDERRGKGIAATVEQMRARFGKTAVPSYVAPVERRMAEHKDSADPDAWKMPAHMMRLGSQSQGVIEQLGGYGELQQAAASGA